MKTEIARMELLNAQALSMQEVQERISVTRSRIDEYKEVGFWKCQNVEDLEIGLTALEKEASRRRYAGKYPNYRFFTAEQITGICRRNNLVKVPIQTRGRRRTGYNLLGIKSET
jgi:hypothetical protein